MAFFEVVAAIFSISSILSLMGKRKGAVDEAGPSRPTRPRRSSGAATSIHVGRGSQTRRDLDPRIPAERAQLAALSHGEYEDRRVLFEARVDGQLFGEYLLFEQLEEAQWGPLFEARGRANAGTARAFYANIVEPTLDPLQFRFRVGVDAFVTIDVRVIARLMAMPLGDVHASAKNLETARERDRRTRYLCGKLAQWQPNRSLLASHMSDDFRLLHHIFTYNLYPRHSNRSECTRLMVDFLYLVGQRANLCVPTFVLRQIVGIARSARTSESLPFGRLVCRIAREYGYSLGIERPVSVHEIDESTLRHMELGTWRRRARREESEADTESEEEDSRETEEEEEESEAQDTEESSPPVAPQPDAAQAEREARMVRIEESQTALRQEIGQVRAELGETRARLEENEAFMKRSFKKVSRTLKAVLCCVQDKDAPPPSPDSDA